MSKQENPARTCADCLHCQACHLWSSGAISDSVAPKCPQFEPARYASLAELQDLYRMHKGELVPVVYARWACDEDFNTVCTGCGKRIPTFHCYNEETDEEWDEPIDKTTFCPNCGAKMYGGADHADQP